MIIINDLDTKINDSVCVTIGKFDGFHLGHMEIIEKVLSYKSKGLKACIVSFYPGPDVIFGKVDKKEIQTADNRRRLCEELGFDYYVEVPFSEKLSRISKEDFLYDYLAGTINAKAIVAGSDVSFGYKGEGNADFLLDNASELHIDVEIVDKISMDGEIISSSLIEDKIEAGEIAVANKMLGKPYSISGEIVVGKKLGRQFGFPTINVYVPEKSVVPAYGVYATKTLINGVLYNTLTNVGINPTVESGKRAKVESYIYDFNRDVYGEIATINFLEYIRPEQKFDSKEALFDQISKDKETVLAFLIKNS